MYYVMDIWSWVHLSLFFVSVFLSLWLFCLFYVITNSLRIVLIFLEMKFLLFVNVVMVMASFGHCKVRPLAKELRKFGTIDYVINLNKLAKFDFGKIFD